jgi:leucyl-tRNA synthetase
LAEELHARLCAQKGLAAACGSETSMAYLPWPAFNPALLVEDTLEMPVQVNGKLRDRIVVSAKAAQAEIEAAALACEKTQQFLAGKTIRKVIVVPRKLVNIVAS